MAKELKNTIQLGLFVVAGIALFTLAIYMVGKQDNLFKPRFRISTIMKNAGGVQKGNNVRYAGIVVGRVEDITIINDTTVQLHLVLEQKVKKFIKKNATASVAMDGVVGNMVVNISPGTDPVESTPVHNGDTIASLSRYGPGELLHTLGSTNENIAILSFKLLELADKLNEGNGAIPLLIRDSLAARELVSALYNLRTTTDNLQSLTYTLNKQAEAVAQGEGTLGYLLHNDQLPHQLETLGSRLDSMLVVQARPIMTNIEHASVDIARSSAELNQILQAINQGPGLSHTLLRDTLSARDMQHILSNLNEGTARFNENMEALKHTFLFKRYYKRLEKKERK